MTAIRTLVSPVRRAPRFHGTRVTSRAVCAVCGRPSDELWWFTVGERVQGHEQAQLVGRCHRAAVEAY